MTSRNAFSINVTFGKYKTHSQWTPSLAASNLVPQAAPAFLFPVATQHAILVTSPSSPQMFDADPLTFTTPNIFRDGATSTTAHWPVGDISGCAFSPDVPGNSSSSAQSFTERDSNYFVLGQNFPEAHRGETTVPFTLLYPADIRLDLFDPQGRKVTSTVRRGMTAGRHTIKLNLQGLGLPAGEYSYQMEARVRYGVYRQSRTMTLL